jgi:hypothetical protein
MYASQVHAQERDCTVFTINVADKIYRCPVSPEALYMLCRDQDAGLSQVDAYVQLKMNVSTSLNTCSERVYPKCQQR